MTLRIPGIYAIKNLVTGDVYGGQAIDLLARRKSHFRALFNGTHRNKKLQADFIKYGSTAFAWKVLTFCREESLCEWEAHFVKHLGATYNQISTPKQIRRDNPRYNPTIQEIKGQQRQLRRKRGSTHS